VFHVRSYAETDSTNDDAVPMLGLPENAGLVLSADFQRTGKGRRARSWVAPAGSSLLVTAILPRPVRSDALWAVPFWTALGVADGIEASTGLRVSLQWPNDLLIEGRKCCGILCVSRVVGDRAWVGCGTGINVRRPPDDTALAEVRPPPAFLSDSVPNVERNVVLEAMLRAYNGLLDDLDRPESIARAWEHRAGLDGTPYRILLDSADEPFGAVARRIGDDGALIVDQAGTERRIALADARIIRS
jgi:BirA family transcriptional regulator, biotin operon repressor / biotin---[acetyl-CoA-carboxylase] ligase